MDRYATLRTETLKAFQRADKRLLEISLGKKTKTFPLNAMPPRMLKDAEDFFQHQFHTLQIYRH